jgi:hypothetical protein
LVTHPQHGHSVAKSDQETRESGLTVRKAVRWFPEAESGYIQRREEQRGSQGSALWVSRGDDGAHFVVTGASKQTFLVVGVFQNEFIRE